MIWEDNFSRRGCLNGWFSHFSRCAIGRALAFYGMVSHSCLTWTKGYDLWSSSCSPTGNRSEVDWLFFKKPSWIIYFSTVQTLMVLAVSGSTASVRWPTAVGIIRFLGCKDSVRRFVMKYFMPCTGKAHGIDSFTWLIELLKRLRHLPIIRSRVLYRLQKNQNRIRCDIWVCINFFLFLLAYAWIWYFNAGQPNWQWLTIYFLSGPGLMRADGHVRGINRCRNAGSA